MSEPQIPPGQEEWEAWFSRIRALIYDGLWLTRHPFADGAKAEDYDEERLDQLRAEHYRRAWLDEADRRRSKKAMPKHLLAKYGCGAQWLAEAETQAAAWKLAGKGETK